MECPLLGFVTDSLFHDIETAWPGIN